MLRLPKPVSILAWNLGILVVLLAALELVFGNWFAADPLWRLQIPRDVSWRYEINYPGIGDDERNVHYTRDRFGLRGDYGHPSNIDILTVGGSTTDQRFISDGNTWQDVLMRRFRASGRDVNIANAGINGRTTFGHLHDFDLWFPFIPGLAPRFVLLYVGINDMFVDRPSRHWDQAYHRDRSLTHLLADRSALYRVFRAVAGTREATKWDLARPSAAATDNRWTEQPLLIRHRERLSARVEGFRTRLASVLERVSAMGATPIVVTQPRGDYRFVNGRLQGLENTRPRARTSVRDGAMGLLKPGSANGVDYYLMLAPFNEVSLELCATTGGICIDLARDLRFEKGDFYDHAHTTVQGSRRIGDFLYERLQSHRF